MEVYVPSDDSFLLVECIKKENLVKKKCLDMGCGVGVESEAMLSCGAKSVLAVDINPNAIKETKKRIKTSFPGHYLKSFKIKKSNLFSNIKEKFDFIAFNPPYVPSDKIKWVDLDGGEKGREIIDLFVPLAKKHLTKKGFILLLISSLNDEKEVRSLLRKNNFSVKIVGRKKLFFEELLVLRIVNKI